MGQSNRGHWWIGPAQSLNVCIGTWHHFPLGLFLTSIGQIHEHEPNSPRIIQVVIGILVSKGESAGRLSAPGDPTHVFGESLGSTFTMTWLKFSSHLKPIVNAMVLSISHQIL